MYEQGIGQECNTAHSDLRSLTEVPEEMKAQLSVSKVSKGAYEF
jgi:hypothetical protein